MSSRNSALKVVVATCAIIALTTGAAAQNASPLKPSHKAVALNGHFVSDAAGTPAENLSGIACQASAAGSNEQLCLLTDDESRGAQYATLTSSKDGWTVTTDGSRYRAFFDPAKPDWYGSIVGRPPIDYPPSSKKVPGVCDKIELDAEDMNLDGEAVALSGNSFVVVGSHGCSRSNVKFVLASFILARMQSQSGAAPELTFRLSEALKTDPLAHCWLKGPNDGGLNIEGLASDGKTLYVGLRAPAKGSRCGGQAFDSAYIVATPVDPLFTKDGKVAPTLVPVGLENGAGIRDMKLLPDGNMLILSGPIARGKVAEKAKPDKNEQTPYQLQLMKGNGSIVPIGQIEEADMPDATSAKAKERGETKGSPEGLEILKDPDANGPMQILIIFDNVQDGGPRVFEATLPN